MMTHEQSRNYGKADPGPDPDWREVAQIAGAIIAGDQKDEILVTTAVKVAREIVKAAKEREKAL